MSRAVKIILGFMLIFFILAGISEAKTAVLSPDRTVKPALYSSIGYMPTSRPIQSSSRKRDVDRTGKSENGLILITGLVFGVILITFAVTKLKNR